MLSSPASLLFLVTFFSSIPTVVSQSYFWSSWSDGKPKLQTSNSAGGKFSVKWSGDKGNFVIGKGWNPGGNRNISYTGTFEPVGNAYLAIYGWTTSPLVEYYIIENYGTHHPSDNPEAKVLGNVTAVDSNDGIEYEYEIMTKRRVNKPSIVGTASFDQYWSIIRSDQRRTGGTVNTAAHFKAWEKVGLKLGRHNYMIVAVEGQDSSGTAEITVGVAPPPKPAATASAPTV